MTGCKRCSNRCNTCSSGQSGCVITLGQLERCIPSHRPHPPHPPHPQPPTPPGQCPPGYTAITDVLGNTRCAVSSALTTRIGGCQPGFIPLGGAGGNSVCSPSGCTEQMLPGGTMLCPDGSTPQCSSGISINGVRMNGNFKTCPVTAPISCMPGFIPIRGLGGAYYCGPQ